MFNRQKAIIILKKAFWPAVAAIVLVLGIFTFVYVRYDYDTKIIQKEYPQTRSKFNLHDRLAMLDKSNIPAVFPWQDYLDSANLYDIKTMRNDLGVLDSFTKDESASRMLFSEILTNRLKTKMASSLNRYNPDSLLRIIQWAEDFLVYARMERENRIFYESVAMFWLGMVSNKLADFSKTERSVKHSFKYKYLVARCHELKFTTPVKVSKTEKVAENLLAGKWGHLVNASWNQTSSFQKMVFLLLVLATFYGYYLIMLKLINKWKR